MQYLVPSQSPISAALRHALTTILGISAADVIEKNEFGVVVSGTTYTGLLPVLRALRLTAPAEYKAFLGAESPCQTALVNQWVSAASLLSADAVKSTAQPQHHISVAPAIYADIERALEASSLRSAFLAGTTRATIADVLLYAAVHNHPGSAAVLPTTMQWSVHAQGDSYLDAVRSPNVKVAAKAASAGPAGTSVYVIPNEEEIARRRLEKEKARKEKEAAKVAAAAAGGAAAVSAAPSAPAKSKKVEMVDVRSLEIRVGRISNLRQHPESDRLYVEDVDLGTETRTIVSGLVDHYKPEELEQSLCFVVCNMKPRPLKGITSQGMVLCASSDSGFVLVRPPAGAQPGDRVVFGQVYVTEEAAAPSPPQPSGNKMTELLSHLRTNEQSALCWKDEPAQLAVGGVVVPGVPNCIVK